MVALTYGDTRVATPESKTAAKKSAKTAAAPRQSFFARFMQAMMESRMRQAAREIRLYAPHVRLDSTDTNTPRGGI